MDGEFITCPDCQGWMPDETGWVCLACEGSGQIWDEYPDDYDDLEGFDAGEWNNEPENRVVDVGDELHQVLADALKR